MLTAFFDIAAGSAPPPPGSFGKTKRAKKSARPAPQPATSTAGCHAKFEPLPPEKNVPRAAEQPGQAWQALHESVPNRDDNIAEFRAFDPDEEDPAGDEFMDEDAELEDADRDDQSEPDFEPESLDPLADDDRVSMGSSFEEDRSLHAFFSTRRHAPKMEQRAVYSGPMLCREDDDFD